MTIKARVERLEVALAIQSAENQVTYGVLIFDPENPPDFERLRTNGA